MTIMPCPILLIITHYQTWRRTLEGWEWWQAVGASQEEREQQAVSIKVPSLPSFSIQTPQKWAKMKKTN